jgi:Cdc6-like AAA superfamily ATPase
MNVPVAKLAELSKVFSPSAPIDQKSLFSGRLPQLMDVINAINQKGQHAILFGERGVGKTSLARVISSIVFGSGQQSMITVSINCDPTMDFSSLWHKIAREISITTTSQGIGFTPQVTRTGKTLDSMLPEIVSPDDVRHLFSRLGKCLIVLDELDRIVDTETTGLLADTIKNLSDHAVDTTLLLVGVADSVDSLIKEHASVERALVQVRMPRMSQTELFEIINKGLSAVQMTIDEEGRKRIAALSQGLPHYTHLLSLYAAQRAVATERTHVEAADVRTAIDTALAKTQQSIISSYHKATSSPRENLYPQVLLSCALAQPDSLGYFAAVDVRPALTRIMKKPYDIPAFSQHLNAFCEEARGPVLQRTGSTRRYRFRFENPLMQPYVIMDGIRKGLITEDLRPSA